VGHVRQGHYRRCDQCSPPPSLLAIRPPRRRVVLGETDVPCPQAIYPRRHEKLIIRDHSYCTSLPRLGIMAELSISSKSSREFHTAVSTVQRWLSDGRRLCAGRSGWGIEAPGHVNATMSEGRRHSSMGERLKRLWGRPMSSTAERSLRGSNGDRHCAGRVELVGTIRRAARLPLRCSPGVSGPRKRPDFVEGLWTICPCRDPSTRARSSVTLNVIFPNRTKVCVRGGWD
jgi:hypothetical protein